MMTNEKLKFELEIQDAIKALSEKTQLALRDSPYNSGRIAERMNMGNASLVERTIATGNIENMQVATLLRLIHASGLEMHVRFVRGVAEEGGTDEV